MRITVLYNNDAMDGFEPDWGFACVLDGGERLLFDIGAKPDILAGNMKAAGVDPKTIGKVVLSHDHWDHADGLPHVCEANPAVTVYVLPSFRTEVKEMVVPPGRLVEVVGPQEIVPGVFTTGPVTGGVRDEQALVAEVEGGVLLVTGCAHPGVDALMDRASERGPIVGIVGGFHGFSDLDRLEGVPFLGACHCTQHQAEIADRFPDAYRKIEAGMVLEF